MRPGKPVPGELVPGEGATPVASPSGRAQVTVRNGGRFPAYLGSHCDLARASSSLEFDRVPLRGARPDLPAGATIRIAAGETAQIDVIWD